MKFLIVISLILAAACSLAASADAPLAPPAGGGAPELPTDIAKPNLDIEALIATVLKLVNDVLEKLSDVLKDLGGKLTNTIGTVGSTVTGAVDGILPGGAPKVPAIPATPVVPDVPVIGA